MNRYSVKARIGEGSFGSVYKAVRKQDEHTVAIKIISKRGRSNREIKNLRRECDIQAQLKHPNVIEMFESFETKNELIVVTEFAKIDLHQYLLRDGALTEQRAQALICHLVSALYYLHSNRILHRDLKPQNVLLDEHLHAKLCDFGLARNMTMGTHVLTSIKGTPLYMAPELLAEKPYNHQADLWSLGCIAYESMAGQPPFCSTSILHLVKIIKHEEVKWPSFLSNQCISFLQGLLEKDPSLRISWAQILCHPFVEGKLYIAGTNEAANSPFINPKPVKTAEARETSSAEELNKYFGKASKSNRAEDNITTSRDSINAIAPSDIEQLETDVEDNINRIVLPFQEQSFSEQMLKQHLQPYVGVMPLINAQTCFVAGNSNLILNHLNDNFPTVAANETESAKMTAISSMKKSRSKDLEKRKLSQNLDNFSLRLGQQSVDAATTNLQKKDKEHNEIKEKHKEKDKEQQKITQSTDEKQSLGNSPPCLPTGWDSCDESQSPPIENDEWLAFLNRSMQEVLDGELDSLKQQNLVSIIVAPLRNSKAIPKVLDSVAQLLSLPFVLCEQNSVLELIKTVYVDVKLVPNLMYASKLLICQRGTNDSSASLQQNATVRIVRTVAELNTEELRTAARLYELICHLVHLKQQFLSQFCDAIAILAADEILINFLNHDFSNVQAVRASNCMLALLCCVLRELPENAELVEKVIYSSKLNLIALLQNKNDLLRMRMCMLFRLLARFCLRGLQNIWNVELRKAIEQLADDANADVKDQARCTLEELQQFAFYA